MTTVLDIGCGKRKIEPDSLGIDKSPDSSADVIWDLDQYPWPLESGRFTRIHMSHVIEHLDDVVRAMGEVHRVAADGADVFIATPHFSSHNSYTDPAHRRHMSAASFAHFSHAGHKFDVVEVKLIFGGNLVLDNAGRLLAAMSLTWYERHAAWVLPAGDIRCHLRVRK